MITKLEDIRILVGDDEGPTRYLLKKNAKPCGVHEVLTGAELVKEAEQAIKTGNLYSLIISDNKYGAGISGIDAIRQIREFDEITPIYWHSGDVDEDKGENDPLVKEAREAGATDAMVKDSKKFTLVLTKYKSIWAAQIRPVAK